MDFKQIFPQVLTLMLAMRITRANVIAAFPLHPQSHAVPIPLQSIPVFTNEHSTVFIATGPHSGVISPPIANPYNTAQNAPVLVPLKLLFTRFPPFIEAIVQRIQNYYSTYNYPSDYITSRPPQDPVQTSNSSIADDTDSKNTSTTASTIVTTTTAQEATTTPITTTPTPPQPVNVETRHYVGYHPPGIYRQNPPGVYRQNPPVINPFRYNQFQYFPSAGVYYPTY